MANSVHDTGSVLVVDVGSVKTRALLFNLAEGCYRFICAGIVPSTVGAPAFNALEGVNRAIRHLESITGQRYLDEKGQLIMPADLLNNGVDDFTATFSAGPPFKLALVGLSTGISLESLAHLAASIPSGEIEVISLNDHRKPEERIDAILCQAPEMILVAGGTENGASHSLLELLDSVRLACQLLPDEEHPEVLYAGNNSLQEEIQFLLESSDHLHFVSNLRPTIDSERMEDAQSELTNLAVLSRSRRYSDLKTLEQMTGGKMLPASSAFGWMVRFLSKAHTSSKGVLGVNVGAAATTLAGAYQGYLSQGVYPELGLATGLDGLLKHLPVEQIQNWMSVMLPGNLVREYLANKALYPQTVPYSEEELAIEFATTRLVLQQAVTRLSPTFPKGLQAPSAGLLPGFEPVIASGSVLTNSPGVNQAFLALLDGLQPTGVTTLVLDQEHILAALGVASQVNPLLSVQVLDSSAFRHLGTVISPVGRSRPGTPVLRVRVGHEDGHEEVRDFHQGALEVLKLPAGQSVQLHLQPFHKYDVGMGGPGRSGTLKVNPGQIGVVIDARGRPFKPDSDPARRIELMNQWLWQLAG